MNITYRLPKEISDFISRNVYDGKLVASKKSKSDYHPVEMIETPGIEEYRGSGIFVKTINPNNKLLTKIPCRIKKNALPL